jgi:hypothetical protein
MTDEDNHSFFKKHALAIFLVAAAVALFLLFAYFAAQ